MESVLFKNDNIYDVYGNFIAVCNGIFHQYNDKIIVERFFLRTKMGINDILHVNNLSWNKIISNKIEML